MVLVTLPHTSTIRESRQYTTLQESKLNANTSKIRQPTLWITTALPEALETFSFQRGLTPVTQVCDLLYPRRILPKTRESHHCQGLQETNSQT